MNKFLELKINVGRGAESTPFPNSDAPIVIRAFRYDAKRMGGAPTITASVNYPSCLDDEWTDNVYAEFNGEKYYLKQTPTSSYDNADTMYKHDITLVSERVALDNVYFFDVVTGNPMDSDKPVSNSTKVVFFGDVREFASRLQASLEYSGLDYTVVVDDEVISEEKLMSFEDQFFSDVLQEIYNTYEVPYYFVGKTIHIGDHNKLGEDEQLPVFAYGVDDALLSITKNNANYKIVNRATGTGSSDNIPFYYPNKFPNGEVEIETTTTGGGITSEDIKIFDREAFSREFRPNTTYTFFGNAESEHSLNAYIPSENTSFSFVDDTLSISKLYTNTRVEKEVVIEYEASFDGEGESKISLDWELSNIPQYVIYSQNEVREGGGQQRYYSKDHLEFDVYSVECAFNGGDYKKVDYKVRIDQVNYLEYCKVNDDYADTTRKGWKARQTGIVFNVEKSNGTCIVRIKGKLKTIGVFWQSLRPSIYNPSCDITFTADVNKLVTGGWRDADGNSYDIEKGGVELLALPKYGDTFLYNIVKYVNTSDVLMPYVYRMSDAKERFYNAVNYPFPFTDGYILKYREYVDETTQMVHNDAYKDKNGDYIRFNAPFFEGKPKEHIIKVDDIKPSIEEMEYNGQRIDMFEAFAYDENDNDDTYEDEEGNVYFNHPYFFAKLKPLGFNLFDHAIEQQPMVISFTSGDCGACSFEIAVDEDTQKNTVQVDENGNVKRDEDGNVLCGSEALNQRVEDFQDIQQDTTNRSVWIALRKEEDTYGILMPKAPTKDEQGNEIGGHRPSTEDTFVILGINLPYEYIEHAEKKLEAEIIKYLKENNDEKFTFSISFSRIYFTENPDILLLLSENSKIKITYNNKEYDLYVSSFSYSMGDNDVLPEIRVELDDTLKVSQNALQNAISEVKSSLGSTINEVAQAVAMQRRSYVSKVEDDNAQGVVNFTKGIKFGEGGKVEVMDNNSAKLTIEYLEVTKKASFTSLEIQEKTHVGGQILVTPASINCGEVEELDDVYRCYFQTKGADGDEIFNQFAVGDQAICQTYNAWGSVYYWRLVTGIGEDYIDLSKTDCDEDSGIPKAGDKIIQLGNRADVERQNAIVIAAYGDGSPYIIQYKGINSFEIGDDKVVTKLSSTENIFTGKVHMEMGSDGVENLNLEIGGQNLLRNSGFTGDYLSEQLADEKVLEGAAELYSSPLDHWTYTKATVVDSDESTSGKAVSLNSGTLSQTLYYKTTAGEQYVLSFKAKGRGNGSLVYAVGDASGSVALTSEMAFYEVVVTPTTSSDTFVISDATCIIGDLKLEKGNKATSWSASPLDNTSDRAYYQSMKYIQNAFEGATDIKGGLVLTEQIQVGDYDTDKKEWVKMNGGMSGVYESDHDVAFWAGGDFTQAIQAVMKYDNDPTYQPTEEELASMAKFVVTHGGRAILNDIILRGYIYAIGGNIGALKIENNGISVDVNNFSNKGGRIRFTSQGLEAIQKDGSFAQLGTCGSQAISISGKDASSGVCYGDEDKYKIAAQINAADKGHAIHCLSGLYAGLRPMIREIYESDSLDALDHTIIVDNDAEITLTLPRYPGTGQTYKIIHRTDKKVNISAGRYVINTAKSWEVFSSFSNIGVVTLTYNNELWYAEIQ